MTCFLKRKQAPKLLLVSFWACMNWILHAFQFPTNFEYELHLFRAKKFDWFLALFQPFFPARPTSPSYTDPLKVLPEGSVVENLPSGSKEAPQIIIGKKNSAPPNPKLHSQPSVHWEEQKLHLKLLAITFWDLWHWIKYSNGIGVERYKFFCPLAQIYISMLLANRKKLCLLWMYSLGGKQSRSYWEGEKWLLVL